MANFINQFKQSLETGFIDKSLESELLYQPKLLINNKNPRIKILTALISELENCEEFFISVAFLTTGGLASIINSLIELEKNNIKGKIVVSQYLNFTQPEALKRLLQFKNIDLRIATNVNAHAKGYLFKKKQHFSLIIGSSNLTQSALSSNKEWNLQVSATEGSKIIQKVYKEFINDFNSATLVTYDFIIEYEKIYQKRIILLSKVEQNLIEQNRIAEPNQMQIKALDNLSQIRHSKKSKALIISATGTGKTYLSAFDAKAFNPNKLLFVVHRLSIAQKAMETFKKVFGNSKSMGIYSGQTREIDKEFLFCTIQTLSKENHLNKFTKEYFDYIIIDESHRSGAKSYTKLIEHFSPKFLLGMTATPERTDGLDIFKLFDHNIAYEIRLNNAMEEEMLCPFHYYGVTDLSINQKEQNDFSHFNKLISDERVNQIISKSRLYGTDNGVCRGLIFVSKVEEAKELSGKFNQKGYKTVALSGENPENERVKAIELLESENEAERLDYIFTVDIFNEGIDIPKVNQIIMLRPTESAIIFVQQLGRGLRKLDSKSYLTVIDFIGNHSNNYLIPIALFGDTSYNKDRLRKLISNGSNDLPGVSTINFDIIAKEKIFESIDATNMKLLKDLKKDYSLLKYRLGRIPFMVDFIKAKTRDPYLFVEYSKSYFNFVRKVDKEFDSNLQNELLELLNLFSLEINNGKRVEESIVLKYLLENDYIELNALKSKIKEKYNYKVSDEAIQSIIRNLNFEFVNKKKNIVTLTNGIIKKSEEFNAFLKNNLFKMFLMDSTNYSINIYDSKFSEKTYNQGFLRFQKYNRKDVCRILNWEKDVSSTVYGYRTRKKLTPCFVTYHKDDDIEDSINYNDHFISPTIFAWESRSNRKITSPEIQNVIQSERVLLFIKKADSEGTDFYYMGDVSIIPEFIKQAIMPDSGQPVVHFRFKLDEAIPENLYNYITDKSNEKIFEVQNNHSINIDINKKKQIGNSIQKDLFFSEEKKFQIPLYDLYAAAGSFSEMQTSKEYSLISVPEEYKKEGYFAFKVFGESMNRRIPDGSICIFKHPVIGSRNGKILLIEYFDRQDPDLKSHFTVKTYTSSKTFTGDSWYHDKIILKPNSSKNDYDDIVITQEDIYEKQFNVVGEFVNILQLPPNS